MTIRPLHCLGRKLLVGSGALLLGWAGAGPLASQAFAQGAEKAAVQDAAPVQRNYLNKSVIQLPIQINEQSRSLISEIQLFVKESPTAPWTKRDQVGPSAKAFTFQVQRDGEYWFTMVTVDKQGRGYPSDLKNEPPGLVVMIDTTPPQIDLTNLGSTPEGQLIQCEVRDANLDIARTKFFYQGGDKVFRTLEQVAGRPNVFCIPSQAVCTGLVRAVAEDLAGNQALREVHLSQMAGMKTPVTTPPQQQAVAPLPIDKTPMVNPPQQYVTPIIDVKPAIETMPNRLPTNLGNPPPILPVEPQTNQKPAAGSDRPDWKDGPRLETAPASVQRSPEPTPVHQTNHQEALKRQFVNNTKVFLDYQIENAGQSGVGKVEVWITRDRAKSWEKISEDTQRKSPVEIQFPGDGLFGVTLVASNGRGLAGTPPAAGDTPDWWIEVDTTKPNAQISKIHSTTENGQAVVHIHWSVQDKNLADGPVELLYAATPQGPWLPIAKGLKAEGQHRWSPPVTIGAQAHLRLVAHDAAGNTAIVFSQEPVQFDDPVRPRAVIRGISTGATSSATQPTLPIVQPPVTK
jgi:hypothetical protein